MTDQLIFNNYLLVLKSTVEVYVHGTLESSNEDIRNILKKCLNDILSYQAEVYDIMQKNGWYQKENIKSDEILKTINKIENNS